MKKSENWRSRQTSATSALVNWWACSSRLRWRRTFPECSIRSPRSQNKYPTLKLRNGATHFGRHSRNRIGDVLKKSFSQDCVCERKYPLRFPFKGKIFLLITSTEASRIAKV